MLIPEEVQKCTVFLSYLDKRTMQLTFAGTAFFVDVPADTLDFIYLVTARHVIVEIRQYSANDKVYVRMNAKIGGSLLVESRAADWWGHPMDTSVNVFILPFAPDPRVFDYLPIVTSMFATPQVIRRDSIGVGDQVYVTGLFDTHGYRPRNIPVLKGGHIAAMLEEQVYTPDFGDIDTLLVEMASGSGLIGSPVFVQLGAIRLVNHQIAFFRQTDPHTGTCYFLGLMHGPWEVYEKAGEVNRGIAMVIPAAKILEIINRPEWVARRKTLIEEEQKKRFTDEEGSLPTEVTTEVIDDVLN